MHPSILLDVYDRNNLPDDFLY